MKQLLLHPRTGEICICQVPAPSTPKGFVLVRTVASVISAGTERSAIDFARANLFKKACSRPDLMNQVLGKIQRDGLIETIAGVRRRLDQPALLGYSCAGTIVQSGDGVNDLHPGDRVACAGHGYAGHAEFVSVPRNLVAKIPQDDLSFETAAFSTLGAIALHGFRLSESVVGEIVAVVGLGLIGLLAVQICKAAGCTVIAIDPNPSRCELAQTFNCHATPDPSHFESLVQTLSKGVGADAVLIAAASSGDGPVNLAGRIARQRGRVVAIGAVGTTLPRNLYYEKELDFRISRSYGPGRYDNAYEERGHDYPIAYVRWTEQRNLEAFLQLVTEHRVRTGALVTHRFSIDDAPRAYNILSSTSAPYLAIVLEYTTDSIVEHKVRVPFDVPRKGVRASRASIGLIGAGNFANGVLLPAIRTCGRSALIAVAGARGFTAEYTARKFGFRYSSSDPASVIADPKVSTVVITTPHHLHTASVLHALQQGKHVFCEKPLCISATELREIVQAYESASAPPQLMVGYNRRFAPMILELKAWLASLTGPFVLRYRVNAGRVPSDHWIRDPERSGGRVVGEACHFVDAAIFLIGSQPRSVRADTIANGDSSADNALLTLEFLGGSVAAIHYLANGDPSFGKERIEVFGGQATAVLDDFRRLELVRNGRRAVRRSLLRRDKGYVAEWRAFLDSLTTGTPAIPFEEIVTSTLTALSASESCQRECVVDIEAARARLHRTQGQHTAVFERLDP